MNRVISIEHSILAYVMSQLDIPREIRLITPQEIAREIIFQKATGHVLAAIQKSGLR